MVTLLPAVLAHSGLTQDSGEVLATNSNSPSNKEQPLGALAQPADCSIPSNLNSSNRQVLAQQQPLGLVNLRVPVPGCSARSPLVQDCLGPRQQLRLRGVEYLGVRHRALQDLCLQGLLVSVRNLHPLLVEGCLGLLLQTPPHH